MDYPGLNVSDGLPDLLTFRFASFASSSSSPSEGLLWGVFIPFPTYPLSAIHPKGSARPAVRRHPRRLRRARSPDKGRRPTPAFAGQDRDLDAHAGRLVLTATIIRGGCASPG